MNSSVTMRINANQIPTPYSNPFLATLSNVKKNETIPKEHWTLTNSEKKSQQMAESWKNHENSLNANEKSYLTKVKNESSNLQKSLGTGLFSNNQVNSSKLNTIKSGLFSSNTDSLNSESNAISQNLRNQLLNNNSQKTSNTGSDLNAKNSSQLKNSGIDLSSNRLPSVNFGSEYSPIFNLFDGSKESNTENNNTFSNKSMGKNATMNQFLDQRNENRQTREPSTKPSSSMNLNTGFLMQAMSGNRQIQESMKPTSYQKNEPQNGGIFAQQSMLSMSKMSSLEGTLTPKFADEQTKTDKMKQFPESIKPYNFATSSTKIPVDLNKTQFEILNSQSNTNLFKNEKNKYDETNQKGMDFEYVNQIPTENKNPSQFLPMSGIRNVFQATEEKKMFLQQRMTETTGPKLVSNNVRTASTERTSSFDPFAKSQQSKELEGAQVNSPFFQSRLGPNFGSTPFHQNNPTLAPGTKTGGLINQQAFNQTSNLENQNGNKNANFQSNQAFSTLNSKLPSNQNQGNLGFSNSFPICSVPENKNANVISNNFPQNPNPSLNPQANIGTSFSKTHVQNSNSQIFEYQFQQVSNIPVHNSFLSAENNFRHPNQNSFYSAKTFQNQTTEAIQEQHYRNKTASEFNGQGFASNNQHNNFIYDSNMTNKQNGTFSEPIFVSPSKIFGQVSEIDNNSDESTFVCVVKVKKETRLQDQRIYFEKSKNTELSEFDNLDERIDIRKNWSPIKHNRNSVFLQNPRQLQKIESSSTFKDDKVGFLSTKEKTAKSSMPKHSEPLNSSNTLFVLDLDLMFKNCGVHLRKIKILMLKRIIDLKAIVLKFLWNFASLKELTASNLNIVVDSTLCKDDWNLGECPDGNFDVYLNQELVFMKNDGEDLFEFIKNNIFRREKPKHKKNSFLLNIEKFIENGFSIKPNYGEICLLELWQIKNLSRFSIENKNGKIEFLDPVDLTEIDLSEIVTIKRGSVELYEENGKTNKKPKPKIGEKLNVSAKITLYKVFNKANSNNREFYEKSCEKMGVEFSSYDQENGILVFKVKHF